MSTANSDAKAERKAKAIAKAMAKSTAAGPEATAANPADEPEPEEALFDAPERGSADELLDAGAHSELDAMRHSAAHVMAEAVLELFPGHPARDRPGDHRRLLLRLQARSPADPRRSRRDRGADGRVGRRRSSVRPARAAARRGQGVLRRAATSRSRSRSSTTSRPRAEAAGDADAADERLPSTARSSTCARARTSRAPARSGRSSCSRSPARTGAATRSGRPSSGSTARSGRARRISTPTSGGGRRRRSATTAGSALQLDLFSFHDVSPGSAFWHPKGQRIWRTLEGAMRELQERRGYEEISTPILVSREALAPVRPLGPLSRQHVPRRVRGADVQPQADELPRVLDRLPDPRSAPTATCRFATTSTAGCIATSGPAR